MGILTPSNTPLGIRVGMLVIGAVLTATGVYGLFFTKEPHLSKVSFNTILLSMCGAIVAIIWLFPFGRYEYVDGAPIEISGAVNATTKGPWTVTIVVLLITYFGGRALANLIGDKSLRTAMGIWWVVGPAFLIFLVLRDPEFDWDYIFKVDLPLALAFGVGGAALMYTFAKPGMEDAARGFGALLAGFAVFNWVAAFFGWYPMLQKVRLSFLFLALFVLLAPTFAGEKSARIRYAGIWVGLIVISHWLITGINTPSTLDITAPPFLGGFVLTVSIAYYVMLASFPLGILLALARTSKMPIFRVMATIYIEFIRGIPLITVLFFFSIMLNLFLPQGMSVSELAAVFTGYTVFSAAYMAENIRGGLQSIRKGQFEAADALGLTTMQRTGFIVLPQALRVSIPNLVGQAIATFKETSLIAIVGGFDFLRVANNTIPNQSDFLGQKRVALLFICVVYRVFAYSMSRASRNLEVKLGVGQGR
jgi:His/Glu/Gln/Arg/opine family amino acid ABC transporter permease subunit